MYRQIVALIIRYFSSNNFITRIISIGVMHNIVKNKMSEKKFTYLKSDQIR